MKRNLALLLALLLASAAFAQKPAAISDVEKNLRTHVEYLASDKLEGRRTGEQGATYASGYIANLFAQYKLKGGVSSANGKPAYLQPFPYVAGVTLGAGNTLNLNGKALSVGTDWSPLGYSLNGSIPASPVIFAGYGVTEQSAKYDDYAGLDVKDKIVLIVDGTPDASNPHSPFARFNTHIKANIAKDKGARAIIIIAATEDFRTDRLARLVYDRSSGETAIPVIGISRSIGAQMLGIEPAGLAEIEKLVVKLRTDAIPNVRVNIDLPPATAELRTDLVKQNADAYNVIGVLEGTDPVLKSEAIVIGAHYDHLGRGGQGSLAVNSSDIHHGADDNASGTSAILELARQFAQNRDSHGAGKKTAKSSRSITVAVPTKRTIIFIAFSGEEEGLLGSNFYVNNPIWPLEKTVAMINLDMVGRLKDNKLTVGGIGTAEEWKRKIEGFNTQAAELLTTDLGGQKYDDLTPGNDPRFSLQLNEDGFGPSDHSSFYSKKIPVLFLFTGTHNEYHKPSDTADKINYSGLQRVVHFVRDIAVNIDESVKPPTYTVAKSSGTMGRTGFNVSLGTVPNYAETTDGLLLDAVRDNSPAAKAGLKPGDKIIKLAGHDVRNAMDYTFVLGTMKAGEEYEVVLKRGTETITLKIIPAPAARRP